MYSLKSSTALNVENDDNHHNFEQFELSVNVCG